MEELLALIAGVDDEEDLLVRLTEVVWPDWSIQLRVDVRLSDDTDLGSWAIRCEQVLTHALYGRGNLSLELTADHPLLWEFQHAQASAYFLGVPSNSAACVGSLYEAHAEAVSEWIDFGRVIHRSKHLSELLAQGNGLLARGSISLLARYRDVLKPFGVEVSIVGEYEPKFWDGTQRRSLAGEDVKALLLGESYVVGIGWSAKRI